MSYVFLGGSNSYTISCDNYERLETDKTIEYQWAVPGVTVEEILLKVDNHTFTLTVPQTRWNTVTSYTQTCDFKLVPENIECFIKNGVLTITITKPNDYSFEVDIKEE